MNGSTLEVELAEATAEKRRLQARIKELDTQIDGLEAMVLEAWKRDGITSMKVKTADGPALCYLSSPVWAKADGLLGLDLAKVENEWPGLQTLNWSKASSLLRELLARDDKEGLAQLAAAGVLVEERQRINVKKG